MNTGFNRRQFLAATGTAAAIGATGNLAQANSINNTPTKNTPAKDKLFEISLAQWSLHRTLRSGKLDNLDFAKTAKEEFGISGVEYVNQFFKDKAGDEKYLGQMKKRASDHGVKSVLIMIDGEGALGDANEAGRTKAIENHHQWVSAAKFLGCHSIRVNAQSRGSYQEQVSLAADGLSRLSEYAAKMGINVIVENHGGLSSNGQWLAQVIRKVNMDNCGTLPDFGNFRIGKNKKTGKQNWYDRYMGMAALLPFAKAVSAKSHDFDDQGNETSTDYLKVMQMVMDSGYHSWVGIEYEGGKLSEADGIKATKKLLESCRQQLSDA